jgi:hypothetical protein
MFEDEAQETHKDSAAACLYFLSYLAFIFPAADRTESAFPFIGSRGFSYGFPLVIR